MTFVKTGEPIICGRRICIACRRWRHTTDFRWQWKMVPKPKRPTKKTEQVGRKYYRGPYVDTTCNSCRAKQSAQHRVERLVKMTQEQTRAYLDHRTKLERDRRARNDERLQRRLKAVRHAIPQFTERNGEKLLPLTPFRMWLLRHLALNEKSIQTLAEQCGYDESRIRHLVDGFVWEGPCDPNPIHTIALGIVDHILVNSGAPESIDDLYPWEEDE